MLPYPVFVLLFFQNRLVLLPGHNDVPRVNVVNQSRVRVDPLRLPFRSTNVLDDFNALEWRSAPSPLAERVLYTGLDLRSPHSTQDDTEGIASSSRSWRGSPCYDLRTAVSSQGECL